MSHRIAVITSWIALLLTTAFLLSAIYLGGALLLDAWSTPEIPTAFVVAYSLQFTGLLFGVPAMIAGAAGLYLSGQSSTNWLKRRCWFAVIVGVLGLISGLLLPFLAEAGFFS